MQFIAIIVYDQKNLKVKGWLSQRLLLMKHPNLCYL
jgi:hypothetical protein